MAARTFALIAACLAAVPACAQTNDEKVRGDLQSLLLPGVSMGMGGLESATGSGQFRLRPIATRYRGLCRRDELAVGYAGPIGYGPEIQAKRVRFSVETHSYYRILDGIPTHDDLDWATFSPLEGPCVRLTGEERGWFRAPNAGHAADGYEALTQALTDLRAGKRQIPGCHQRGKVSYLCGELLAADLPDDLASIWPCEAKEMRACYRIEVGSNTVTIHMRYKEKGPGMLERVEIQGLPGLQ